MLQKGSRLMIMLAAALLLAAADSNDALVRSFNDCLKTASSRARAQNAAVESFDAFIRTSCNSIEQPFRAGLVKLNIQHGMSRKDAEADADWTVNDYYAERLENYKSEAGSAQPKSAKTAEADRPK
jgi:hypothetical protein